MASTAELLDILEQNQNRSPATGKAPSVTAQMFQNDIKEGSELEKQYSLQSGISLADLESGTNPIANARTRTLEDFKQYPDVNTYGGGIALLRKPMYKALLDNQNQGK
jgi:hypothetical protein